MSSKKLYAVITGDIVGSTDIKSPFREQMSSSLKQLFSYVESRSNPPVSPAFEIFRGDSFQGVVGTPALALESALRIRAGLRSIQPKKTKADWDARLAIGIGTIEYLADNVAEGDGRAYRNSGPVLDKLKGEYKIAIRTPWEAANDELMTECALLDAIIGKWSAPQAEIVTKMLDGMVQKAIAKDLGISQAAVHYRKKGASWFAVEKFLNRYHTIINHHMQQEP